MFELYLAATSATVITALIVSLSASVFTGGLRGVPLPARLSAYLVMVASLLISYRVIALVVRGG